MEWADGKQRCWWANPNNEAYVRYHDEEWGVPVRDDRMLFEMLILEGFQAGLSWECVLNKRAAFRRAFDNFDAQAVSAYGPEKLAALQSDAGIIRNRLKIRAAVGNARAFLAIQQDCRGFSRCCSCKIAWPKLLCTSEAETWAAEQGKVPQAPFVAVKTL